MGGRGGGGGGGAGVGGPASSLIAPGTGMTMDDMPQDVIDNPPDAGASKAEKEAHKEIVRSKGVPNRVVRVYRPVGEYRNLREFQKGRGIEVNHSEWVSTSYQNALDHTPPGGSVAEFHTSASNLSRESSSGNLSEWTYSGPDRRNVPESPGGRVNRYQGGGGGGSEPPRRKG